DPHRRERVEHLLERRHADRLAGERPGAVGRDEPPAGVEPVDLGEVELAPGELGAAGARRGLVVGHDQLVVAGDVNVHLQRVDPDLDRALERGQGVLGALGRRATVGVQPTGMHHESSSSSSACAGTGGGRGSETWMTSAEYWMSFSASGWTSRTSTSSPVTFSIRSTTFMSLSPLATSFSPTSSLTSLGNADRFIFLSGCIDGLPNASLALMTPSRLAPFSSPASTASRPGSMVPPPWMYSTVLFSRVGPPTTDSSTFKVTRRPFSIFTRRRYT